MREQNPHPDSRSRGAIIRTDGTDPARRAEDQLVRLQFAVHEIAGLITGSLHSLDRAQSLLQGSEANETPLQFIESAHSAISHIAELVRGAYRPHGFPAPSSGEGCRSFASTIFAAIDVLRPEAEARAIGIELDVEDAFDHLPSMPIYGVISNGLRNAMEAINRKGNIQVSAKRFESATGSTWVRIEIIDDGPGPPVNAADRVFQIGYTTKAGSHGIGLSLAREVAHDLHGTIELVPREDQRGAILRVTFPLHVPSGQGSQTC